MQTVLAKIVADKAIWVKPAKSSNRLPVFRMTSSEAAVVSMMPCRGAHRLFLSAKGLSVEGVIRDDFDPARIAGIYNIMRQPSPC
jgi:indole-3-glycerol phosphate synthase/phosphoribosylanthranilate isomerase